MWFLKTLYFAAKSAALTLILGSCFVGVVCFNDGDVGPYTALNYIGWVPVAAALIVYATEQ